MKRHFQHEFDTVPATLEDHPFYGFKLDPDQKHMRDCIWNPKNIVTICNSRAGSGKSLVSIGTANLLVQYGLYSGISYIVFPTMEQKQGFIPGDPDDKNAPYMRPLRDALYSLDLNPDIVIKSNDNLQAIKDGRAYIDFMSHTYLRGTNFENQVVIIDEFQNGYGDECKKILTRMHDSCKIIIIGHSAQCDLYKHSNKSGFIPYLNAFTKYRDENPDDERVAICELRINHRGWFSNFCDDVEV